MTGWRVPPPAYRPWAPRDLAMTGESGELCTLPAATYTRGQARAWFAREWGEPFTAIRVELRRLVWDPLTAAIEYRENRCDSLTFAGSGGCCTPSGDQVTPENCLCPWPEIATFWDEDGTYCPWRPPARPGEAPDVTVWWAEYADTPRRVQAGSAVTLRVRALQQGMQQRMVRRAVGR